MLGRRCNAGDIDASTEMLDVARKVAADLEWRPRNASCHCRSKSSSTLLSANKGRNSFPTNPPRRRRCAAQPTGVSACRSDEEIPFFRALRHIAERHLGPITDQRHSFGDSAPLEALLSDAGFHEVRSGAIMRFDANTWLLHGNAMALVGMSAAGRSMDEEQRKLVVDAIVIESEPVRQRYTDGSLIAFELSTNLVTAIG